jgi:hypothetical protein
MPIGTIIQTSKDEGCKKMAEEVGSSQLQEYMKSFLCKIASKTEDIICNGAQKAQFLNSIKAYRETREKFLQALQQCKNEAVENKLFYDENDTGPPIGKEKWEQGWELERDYLIEIAEQPKPIYRAFWRPPLPFDPDAWIMRHYGSPQYNDIVATPSVPKEPKEPDAAENLICEYIVIAVINDNVRTKPQCQKLCSSCDNEWSEKLWGSIYWCKSINDGNAYKYRTANIKNALKNVKAGLAKIKSTEKEPGTVAPKRNKISAILWKLYETTLGVIVDKVLGRFS